MVVVVTTTYCATRIGVVGARDRRGVIRRVQVPVRPGVRMAVYSPAMAMAQRVRDRVQARS
jgi:hypothetical protein